MSRSPRVATELSEYLCLAQLHIVKAYNLILAEDVTLPPWMIVEYIPLSMVSALPLVFIRPHQQMRREVNVILLH